MPGTIPVYPALHRKNPRGIGSLIGLAGAPAAWVVQMSVSNIMVSYACYPHRVPLPAPLWDGLYIWLGVLDMLCLGTALACGFIAFADWRRTGHENAERKTEFIGTGRRHFLAVLGLMSSGLFVAAIFFTACALWLVSGCKPWS